MDTSYIVVSAVGLVALGWSLVNYLRSIVNVGSKPSRDAFIAQTVSYVVFIALAFGAAQSDQFGTIRFIRAVPLSAMDSASLVILGLILGGAGGALHKAFQAFDNTDTARVPPFTK